MLGSAGGHAHTHTRQSPHRWGPPLDPRLRASRWTCRPTTRLSSSASCNLPRRHLPVPPGTAAPHIDASLRGHTIPPLPGAGLGLGGVHLPRPLRGSLCNGVPQPGPEKPPRGGQRWGGRHSTPGRGGHFGARFPRGHHAKGGGDLFPFFPPLPGTVLLSPNKLWGLPPPASSSLMLSAVTLGGGTGWDPPLLPPPPMSDPAPGAPGGATLGPEALVGWEGFYGVGWGGPGRHSPHLCNPTQSFIATGRAGGVHGEGGAHSR